MEKAFPAGVGTVAVPFPAAQGGTRTVNVTIPGGLGDVANPVKNFDDLQNWNGGLLVLYYAAPFTGAVVRNISVYTTPLSDPAAALAVNAPATALFAQTDLPDSTTTTGVILKPEPGLSAEPGQVLVARINLYLPGDGTYLGITSPGISFTGGIDLSALPGISVSFSFPIRRAPPPKPSFTTQPASQTVAPGASLTLTAASADAKTFQWQKDGAPVAGATNATLTVTGVKASDAGVYQVVATNFGGATTSNSATITVLGPPSISLAAVATSAAVAGTNVTLTPTITGTGAITYQWLHNGTPIAGATSAALTLPGVATTDGGNYTVTATNAAGSVTSDPINVTVTPFNTGRLVNLSILTNIADGESFTLGTVLGGSGTTGQKPLLIRASGPTLGAAPFNIGGVLADPILDLFNGQTTAASNDNWGGGSALVAANAAVGAFPFASATSKDAALTYTIDTSVPQSGYTVKVHGAAGTSGLVLAEIYDSTVKDSFATTTPRLINLSVLKPLGTGFTIGFVVDGTTAEKVLVRAVGPQLGKAPFNIGGVVADPKLELFDGNSKSIGGNDDWGSGGAADLTATFAQVGAFALDTGSKDAALVAKLNPGSYTVQVSPASGATGLVLVEVYEVP